MRIRALSAAIGLAFIASTASVHAQGWKSANVGNTIPGTTNIAAGKFTIEGDGDDIWGTFDGFRFVYLKGNGNVEIMARVTSQEQTHTWAKAGVMIRQSLDGGSKHAFMCRTPANGMAFQHRPTTNGDSYNSNGGSNTLPRWVKLRRVGNTFIGYYAPDVGGKPGSWLQQGSNATITMTDPVYVGLAVTSHVYGNLSTAVFDNVVTTGTEKLGAGILIGQARRPADGAKPLSRLYASLLLSNRWLFALSPHHRFATADTARRPRR